MTNLNKKSLFIKKKFHKHKFGAIRVEKDDKKFPSKLEANCYQTLCNLKKLGKILFFLRQIPFDLPGGYVHRVDFCVFSENNVFFVEAKGKDLSTGKMKREQVEDIFNIEIFLAKSEIEILEIVENNK
jgi:hypothetical protein